MLLLYGYMYVFLWGVRVAYDSIVSSARIHQFEFGSHKDWPIVSATNKTLQVAGYGSYLRM